jgi:5-formyltetrahydrofolate cyclo-ligase
MTKNELRREMRRRLRTLDARAEKSRAITEAVAAHPAFTRSDRVALFAPLPGEPNIEGLWEKGARGFCCPRVVDGAIEFVDVRILADLTPSAWNPAVREPSFTEARIIAPAEIELILVPGLAFTRDGHRLGRGGGFYDRFLARLPASTFKLGVCFDLQIVGSLPTEAHDQRVDAVVTECGG